MRDEVLSLLRAKGGVRHVSAKALRLVTSFFAEQFETNLEEARRHPLGFIALLEQLSDDLVLRYHLWPTGWKVPPGQESGQTHDHCFELNSLIVDGALRQQTFRAEIDPTADHSVVQVDYTPGASGLHQTGLRARLETDTDQTFGVGTAYRLAPGVVHRVETVTRPAATLVLAIPHPASPSPRVFVPVGEEIPGEFARDPLDGDELVTVRDAIRQLQQRR